MFRPKWVFIKILLGYGYATLVSSNVTAATNINTPFSLEIQTNQEIVNQNLFSNGRRARRDYWEKLHPASGRPYCPSMSRPDAWGVTKGDSDLMQQKEATTENQLRDLFSKQSL